MGLANRDLFFHSDAGASRSQLNFQRPKCLAGERLWEGRRLCPLGYIERQGQASRGISRQGPVGTELESGWE